MSEIPPIAQFVFGIVPATGIVLFAVGLGVVELTRAVVRWRKRLRVPVARVVSRGRR